jgi:allantoinase
MRIRSRRVVTPEGTRAATLHLEGERIAAIEPYGAADVDYGDLVVMPGLVDSHVHVNEPGRTEWEGFRTATRAAAAGGITTIVDMPLNSIPATTTLAAFETKREALAGQCVIDVALWGGVVPGNRRELKPMLDGGARGFKCFLVDSGVDEFPHVDERALREAAIELAPTGAPLLVHAELGEHLEPVRGDPDEYVSYLRSRPAQAENAAIELLLRVCRETGARIHIVHLSSAGALEILQRAKDERLPMTAETTPHYLHFEAESVPRGRTEFKCAPPIRERDNRERLWGGLASGLLDLVVSDHSPCTPALKEGNFQQAWGGIAGLQLVLPIVWTNARARSFSLDDLARWCCASPARLARLDRKGSIEPGRDADFVVWSPEERFLVTPEIIEHRHKTTPYLGESLYGAVKETWLRGTVVQESSGQVPTPSSGGYHPLQ